LLNVMYFAGVALWKPDVYLHQDKSVVPTGRENQAPTKAPHQADKLPHTDSSLRMANWYSRRHPETESGRTIQATSRNRRRIDAVRIQGKALSMTSRLS